jgi:hypothetical protein
MAGFQMSTEELVLGFLIEQSQQPYGLGAGRFEFTVAANPAGSARTGNIIAGGLTFPIAQDSCGSVANYSVSPTSLNVASSGGTATISVTVSGGCSSAWTSTSNAAFMTIAGGASGTGNGTVTVTIAPNAGGSRTGTLTIAGQTVTVTQSGL